MAQARQYLRNLIDEYLTESIEFDDFAHRYSSYFIDEMDDGELDDDELEWYGAVHERAEWTDVAPDPESRSDGWMDVTQFRDWLRTHVSARECGT